MIRLPEKFAAAATGTQAEADPPPVAALAEPEPAPALVPATPADIDPAPLAAQQEPVELPPVELVDTPADVLQWYAFWSPFRTEIAANGFVAQLQRVTGLDYRIVKVDTGLYEVAFAYSDDDEIVGNLSQISAATGLELPGN